MGHFKKIFKYTQVLKINMNLCLCIAHTGKDNACYSCLLFVHECQQQWRPFIQGQPSSESQTEISQTYQILLDNTGFHNFNIFFASYIKWFSMVITLIMSGEYYKYFLQDFQGKRSLFCDLIIVPVMACELCQILYFQNIWCWVSLKILK